MHHLHLTPNISVLSFRRAGDHRAKDDADSTAVELGPQGADLKPRDRCPVSVLTR
jgi:hypothetical protein